MSNTIKVLIIGRSHLKYYDLMLNKPFRETRVQFESELLMPWLALKKIEAGLVPDVIVTSLFEDHGSELDHAETERGMLTGAVLIRKLQPLLPQAKFVLLEGIHPRQKLLTASPNVLLLDHAMNVRPSELVTRLEEICSQK